MSKYQSRIEIHDSFETHTTILTKRLLIHARTSKKYFSSIYSSYTTNKKEIREKNGKILEAVILDTWMNMEQSSAVLLAFLLRNANVSIPDDMEYSSSTIDGTTNQIASNKEAYTNVEKHVSIEPFLQVDNVTNADTAAAENLISTSRSLAFHSSSMK